MALTASPGGATSHAAFASQLRALGRRRGPRAYLAALAAASAAAAFAPLADHLGYEFAEVVALLAGALGPSLGVAAARLELEEPAPRPGRALLTALAAALAALLLPLAIILLNGLRRPVCDPLAGLALYGALAVPSALLAAALGVACAFLAPRRAGLLAALAFAATLAEALWPILAGPQVFAFHHLGGMYPGPIYDEAIALTPALGWFRIATLAWTAALSGLALVAGHARAAPPGTRPAARLLRSPAGLALLAAGLLPALALSANAEALHWRATHAGLQAALGGELETEHLVLHFPREKSEAERRLLARDAEASVRAVLDFCGTPPDAHPAKVHAWLHRTAEEKRRLIGAADTSFAKPWLRELHTNDAPAPHPVLRHELVHALGADVAHGPFGVPGRLWGLVPDMAFLEGFAVAGDFPGGDSTVHEEAAALRRLGKLPDLLRLFAPGRFYGESGPRAYTAAGSLLRWVLETRGPEALRAAYASSEGLAALGPLEPLARAHATFLDGVAVPETTLALAALRFSAPAIVRKTCAHEVAELERAAAQAGARGDPARAAALLRACAALEPDDPGKLLGLRRALAQAGDLDGAREVEARALAHPKLSVPQRAQLLTDQGDRAWKAGDEAAAAARWEEAARLAQPEGQLRGLQARRAALGGVPSRQATLRRLLVDGDTGPETWLLLRDLDQEAPADGLAAYLLARQAQARGAWETCGRFAAAAQGRALPSPLFETENLRVRGACAVRANDAPAAREAFSLLASRAGPARRLEIERWLALLPP